MSSTPEHVDRPLRLRMLAGAAGPLPLDATLRYRSEDPFAVEATFDTGDSEPVRWVFARDLLSAGLVGTAGEGDVTVAAARDEDGERVVHVRLSSPDGVAVLEVPAAAVACFLARSYAAVPCGVEGEYLRIDSAVETLLDR